MSTPNSKVGVATTTSTLRLSASSDENESWIVFFSISDNAPVCSFVAILVGTSSLKIIKK